jgi:hypothetical protein
MRHATQIHYIIVITLFRAITEPPLSSTEACLLRLKPRLHSLYFQGNAEGPSRWRLQYRQNLGNIHCSHFGPRAKCDLKRLQKGSYLLEIVQIDFFGVFFGGNSASGQFHRNRPLHITLTETVLAPRSLSDRYQVYITVVNASHSMTPKYACTCCN